MSKKLSEYERKRNRKQTPEPFGGKRAKAKAPIFVVQRHDARRLHYDFRLERDGVLASWAVPKGVPLEPGEQHLAVHVEDHPLEYGSFEGEIPKGNYGAGTVEIWDHGTYELLEEKRDGGLTVRLHGERLEGTWALVPAHLSGDEKNWLILRKRDEGAPSGRAHLPADARDPDEGAASRRGLGVRAEVGRLSGPRLRARRRGQARLASRQRPDGAVCGRGEGARQGAAHARRGRRRRGRGARCGRQGELLGDAAGEQPARVRGVRRARDRRRADGRPPADRAQGSAREAARAEPGRPALRLVRRRRSAVRGGDRTASRGRDGEADVVALLRGRSRPRLAEDQDARPAGVRDLRLHEGPGPPQRQLRRARARRTSRQGVGVGRERRHRLQRARRSASCSRSSSRCAGTSRPSRSSRRCRR